MLLLDSFAHRLKLSDIVSRWMVGRPEPGDVMEIKKIVNFNLYISRRWLDWFARDMLRSLHGRDPLRYLVRNKGQLKDFAVDHPRYRNERIDEMIARYQRFPEDFYRDTPIDGAIYVLDTDGETDFVGTSRIKRFRRVAEKGSRRIIDFMLDRVRANADVLAEERARNQGVLKHELVTSEETMIDEFNHAERRVLKSIRQGTIHSQLPDIQIPDVAGVKMIVEPSEYRGFYDALSRMEGIRLVEEERHVGKYNAINLRLERTLPKERLLAEPPAGRFLRVLEYRGFDAEEIPRIYEEFVHSAEEDVRLEMIVSSFQEFMESEIGRCMHEDRVREQRGNQEYNGHLATNIRYLMEYVFSICRSPSIEDIEEIPIKLWVKYMPDTIEREVRNLYVPEHYFFDTIAPPSQWPPKM